MGDPRTGRDSGARGRAALKRIRAEQRARRAQALMAELERGPSAFTPLCETLQLGRGAMWRLLAELEGCGVVTWTRGRPRHPGEVRKR